jgi:phospholipase/carboxylesterase
MQLADLDAPIEVETGVNPRTSIIWLHGLGADGNDFLPVVPELELPENPAIRFIFPHAPVRPVTINGGYRMRAWYDLSLAGGGLHQNDQHMRESTNVIREIVQREIERGIPASAIVLAGFSQGGAVALDAGLTFASRLAGLLILSAPVPDPEALLSRADGANSDVPIFLGHGTQDPIVPFAMGQNLREALEAKRRPVEWHSYTMPHSVCPQEICDISSWIRQVLAGE